MSHFNASYVKYIQNSMPCFEVLFFSNSWMTIKVLASVWVKVNLLEWGWLIHQKIQHCLWFAPYYHILQSKKVPIKLLEFQIVVTLRISFIIIIIIITIIIIIIICHCQERINAMEKLADTSKSFNMTIWFGHHPFSVTTTPSVRKILRWAQNTVVFNSVVSFI